MAVSHIFTSPAGDFTGTITGFNSNGSTLTIAATDLIRPSNWNSVHNQYYTLSGNTTNASTASGTNVVLQAAGGITLAGSTDTIVISAPSVYTALTTQNRQLGASSNIVPGQNTAWVAPFRIVMPVHASTGLHMVSITGSVTSNQTNTVGITWRGGLYQVTGTNNSRFDSIFTTSMGFTFWNSGTASVSYSYNVTSSSSAGSNLMTASVYGLRQLTFNIGSTLLPGAYAWMFVQSTSSAGNSSVLRSFNAVIDNPLNVAMGFVGSATNASIGYVDGGIYATTTNALPASFEYSNIQQTNNQIPYFKMGAV